MPQRPGDDWKQRLEDFFEEARSKREGSRLGITTNHAQGDLLLFCKNYSSGKSILIARVAPPCVTFFVIGLLAEMKRLRVVYGHRPAASAPGKVLHAKTG